jgi:RNA polymerase sigma factor (sigma-70 family)
MYQSDAAFYGFVFTIAKRQLVRAYRKTDDTVHLEHEEDFPHETAHTTDEDTVARALTTLDDISREIIVLHHWSRYTFKEIAEMFGMNENAVRVRHHRALGTLRTTLEKAMKYEK